MECMLRVADGALYSDACADAIKMVRNSRYLSTGGVEGGRRGEQGGWRRAISNGFQRRLRDAELTD